MQEAIVEQNSRFYAALNGQSLEEMEGLWSRTEQARCIHPGWDVIVGWEAIRRSWNAIFDHGARLQVRVRDVEVAVHGEVAWVQCLEEIHHVVDNEGRVSLARCTNLFIREGESWKLLLHHASPIPADTQEESGGLVH